MTALEINGKRAFIFNPAMLPVTVAINDSHYYFGSLDSVRNSESLGQFKETILMLLQRRVNE
jgi:hypothetical protein